MVATIFMFTFERRTSRRYTRSTCTTYQGDQSLRKSLPGHRLLHCRHRRGIQKSSLIFFATVEPLIPRHTPHFTLSFEMVLDGYTREPWSEGEIINQNGGQQQQHNNNEWQSCYGFLKYLQGRKKAAVAKFEATEALTKW